MHANENAYSLNIAGRVNRGFSPAPLRVAASEQYGDSASNAHRPLTDLRFEPTQHPGISIEHDGRVNKYTTPFVACTRYDVFMRAVFFILYHVEFSQLFALCLSFRQMKLQILASIPLITSCQPLDLGGLQQWRGILGLPQTNSCCATHGQVLRPL